MSDTDTVLCDCSILCQSCAGDNRSGEWCEACSEQLEPAWVTCDNCDHDGDEYSFPYVTGADPVDEGDGNGPHVARCGHCTDVD